jgi:hypothetical protein
MEFQRGLSVRQVLEICRLEKFITLSCVLTFETISSYHLKFLYICLMAEQVMMMKLCFGIKDKISFINLPNFLECVIKTTIARV